MLSKGRIEDRVELTMDPACRLVAQWNELSAESSFRLSRVGGNILGMLNLRTNSGFVFWLDGEPSWSVDQEGFFVDYPDQRCP